MATYAIGDVHGCWRTLCALLDRLRFDAGRDRLWFTGDLVNRGPSSLDVLRFVAGLGERAVSVLGNHDLHLVARADGARPAKRRDTLDEIFAASDGPELIRWLRHRPLVYREGGWLLVHAGLLPQWSAEDAEHVARQAESMIRAGVTKELFLRSSPRRGPWSDKLTDSERVRLGLAALTRMRACDAAGRPDLSLTGPPQELPPELAPWFEVPVRARGRERVIFGHWASLGVHRDAGVFGLDSGCVWGGSLTALRLDDESLTSMPSVEGVPG